jgi:hypothetical protein
MKRIRTKFLARAAIACMALAGYTSLLAGTTNVISTFDTDLIAGPFGTNYWPYSHDTPLPTAVSWTNSGSPSGAMVVQLDWSATVGYWDWQDAKIQATPWGTNGITGADTNLVDLSQYDFLEFDAAINQANSQTNLGGNYSGMQCIVQTFPYWGNNPSNIDSGYHSLGNATFPTTNGWQHYAIPVSSWPWTVSVLTFNAYMQQNTNSPIHTEVLIDNIKFTSLGKPPTMKYVKANRGLNIWQSGGQYDRNSFMSFQDGSQYYMWKYSGAPASYSFTLNSFPTDAARSNYVVRLYLIGSAVDVVSPDWSEPNVILMDLGVDTNGVTGWNFRYKTNAPASNGTFYDAGAQILLTNSTPIGKWTLTFNNDTNVTMTAPGGAFTNFDMGVHPNIPDIGVNFTGPGSVYFGSYASGANKEQIDMISTFTAASVTGLGVPNISADWLTETTINTNAWAPVGNAISYQLVATNNAYYVNWTVPDGGFALQTNTVSVGSKVHWSTNTGLPPGTAFPNHKGVLVKPGDLPSSPMVIYRMSSPGY